VAGGLLLGVAVGALIGDLTYKPEPPDPYAVVPSFGRGFSVFTGAVVGGLIGLLVGALAFGIWTEHRTRAGVDASPSD